MMYFINNSVPYLGLVICLYALLSHKVCTASKVNVFNFALFVAIYLLLALADSMGFEPVVLTVIVRCLILIITINIIIKNHTANQGGFLLPGETMSHEDFFNWLRSMQDDKRLSQNEVDTANELLKTTSPEDLKAWLIEVNNWDAEELKTDFMQLSKAGVDYIKKFEAYQAKPYQDSKGVWTIGYGNTYYPNGMRVSPNDKPLTEAEAAELKRTITNRDFVPSVNVMLRDEIKAGKITQNMFDALVSLAYNIGTGALAGSSIIRKLKAGDKLGSANAFRLYNKSGGQVLKGLVNRREEERKIFLT